MSVIDDDPQASPEEIDQARGVIFNPNDQRHHSSRLILRGLKDQPSAVRCAAAPHGSAHHFPTDARPLRVARHLPLIEDQHIADDGCAHRKHLAALDGVKDAERHAPHGAEIIVGQLLDERGIQRAIGARNLDALFRPQAAIGFKANDVRFRVGHGLVLSNLRARAPDGRRYTSPRLWDRS